MALPTSIASNRGVDGPVREDNVQGFREKGIEADGIARLTASVGTMGGVNDRCHNHDAGSVWF